MEKTWKASSRQWAGFVIKEKLKELKVVLKSWSKETFGHMEKRIEEKKEELEKLDIIDDTLGLSEEETTRR
ncbi:hypothetical protein ACS0TY_008215 [Phlomoides rotata]